MNYWAKFKYLKICSKASVKFKTAMLFTTGGFAFIDLRE